MINLFDTHCHFDVDSFSPDRDAQWQHANAQGVTAMVIPAIAPKGWQSLAALTARYPQMYFGLGVHPHGIGSVALPHHFSALQTELLTVGNAHTERWVAIGECGLDALIDVPLATQKQWLDWHIELSAMTQKPLIVHCVKAHNEALRWIGSRQRDRGGVIHAFSGSYDTAMQWIERGFTLGVGGVITYERANKTRKAIARVPRESLVIETDAPDMPLFGYQGARNTPSQLSNILTTLAELRNESETELAQALWCNSRSLFRLTN